MRTLETIDIGARIKKIRKMFKMSQNDLSIKADLARETVLYVEKGLGSIRSLNRIMGAFKRELAKEKQLNSH